MIVAGRIGREYLMQIVTLAVAVVDRIVLTGVLLRIWGVEDFATWSLAGAAAGLVSLFDFGANLYFANRVFFLAQQGRHEEARVAARAGNLVIGVGSLVGIGTTIIALTWWGDDSVFTPQVLGATLALSLVTALKMAMSVQLSVYRAHDQFARQTFILAALDILRIAASIALIALGFGYLPVALAQAMVAIAVCGWILADSPRRFGPRYRFGVGLVPAGERVEAAQTSLGYWFQSAPNTALTYAPVFLLTAMGAGAVVVAQFVLMRTIGNFGRLTLQMFAIVLGQEAARRVAIDDPAGLKTVYREAALFLTAQTACITGLLLALGAPLFRLWTDEPGLYDPLILWLAIGTPLLLPTLALALNLLATANRPWPIALGRTAQFVLTVALVLALPIEHLALRMMAALAIAEMVGYGFPVVRAGDRLVGLRSIPFAFEMLARSLLCAALVFAAATGAALPFASPLFAVAAGMVGGGAVAVGATLFLGMGRERRATLIAVARARLTRPRKLRQG